MKRREFLKISGATSAAIILTPGLLMPVKKIWTPDPMQPDPIALSPSDGLTMGELSAVMLVTDYEAREKPYAVAKQMSQFRRQCFRSAKQGVTMVVPPHLEQIARNSTNGDANIVVSKHLPYDAAGFRSYVMVTANGVSTERPTSTYKPYMRDWSAYT